MRKLYIILSFLTTLLLTAQTAPSIQWQRAYGGSESDQLKSIQSTISLPVLPSLKMETLHTITENEMHG
ncbi:hypothetical protein [Chryseobacterium bernardetii]|uniref:hypothetical protein n=1 Tax=Chryseobacterium bernardetii TaxID=1241978 RepID=UPI001E5677CA|nr:hypothetical protein [Chryseobacterium bernardetii]